MSDDVKPDPRSMPLEDLAEMVNATEAEVFDDPLAGLEQDQETEAVEEEPTEEAKADATTEEPEETPKDATGKPDASPGGDLPEHIRLKLEAAEAERKKFEALAGRHAGELGFLRNKLKALESRMDSSAEPDYAGTEETPSEPAPKSASPVAQWAVQQAVYQATSAFTAAHPDADQYGVEIMEYLQSIGVNPADWMAYDDPIAAAKDVTEAVQLGYFHVASKAKHEAAEKAEQEASRRNADNVTRMASRRRAVAATPNGGVRAAGPNRQQDPRKMPLDDLKNMIERIGAEAE